MSRVVEVVFYIHGVSPQRRVSSHTREYRALHNGVASLEKIVEPTWPTHWSGAEWGHNFDGGEMRSHKALTEAQRVLGTRTMGLVDAESELGVPFSRKLLRRLRNLILYGFADIFYYVSKDGKWAIRYEVACQLRDYIRRRRGKAAETEISLTILAHSAGAVIALDFLYYIFNEEATSWLNQGDSEFAQEKKETGAVQQLVDGLSELRELAQNGKLRLRRLFTFGSPVAFLMLRNDKVVEIFAQNDKLNPKDFGLSSELKSHDLNGPRWINMWDKDDLIAWPAAALMNNEIVKDVNVNVGFFPGGAHTNYWTDEDCHHVIAKYW